MRRWWRKLVFNLFKDTFEEEISVMLYKEPKWGFMWADLMNDVYGLKNKSLYPIIDGVD